MKYYNSEILPILKHYQKRKLSAAKYHLQQSAINHEILHEYDNHFRINFSNSKHEEYEYCKKKKNLVFICREKSKINIKQNPF